MSDLEQMHDIIKQETGSYTHIVRFPGGSSNTVSMRYNKGIMSKLAASLSRNQYVYFDWNVSSGDAGETTNTSHIVDNIIEGCEKNDKSIVLQHDIYDFSIEAVEEVIKWGKENGYTFLPLYIDSFDAHHGFNN
jgi:peptidoglycan/xylan/chitin deacetylase (PgdA/CDA1 family)